ncbi:DUF885 family protein [Massilia sp. B-10]|nr:DUF885 family protein [Massilia sp. B-10]
MAGSSPRSRSTAPRCCRRCGCCRPRSTSIATSSTTPRLAHEAKQFADLKDALDTLKRYDRAALDHDGQLSYDVLAFYLQSQVDGEAFLQHDFPVNQLFGAQSDTPNFMTQVHQVTDLSEANNYIARLNKIPRKFDQVIESLTLRETKGVIPPRFAVDKVLVQMKDFSAKVSQGQSALRQLRRQAGQGPRGRHRQRDPHPLAGAGRASHHGRRLSVVPEADRLLHRIAAEGQGKQRRLEPARRRQLLCLVRAQAHHHDHDAAAGARPGAGWKWRA